MSARYPMGLRYWTIAALLGSLVAVPDRSTADSWTTYGHDPQNTARSDVQFDPRQLRLSWASPDLSMGYSASVLSGSALYAEKDYQVASFDMTNGHVNWTYSNGIGPPESSLAESSGLIAFTSEYPNTSLTLLNAQTGALVYNVPNVPGTFDNRGPSPVLVHGPGNLLTAFTVGYGATAAISLGSSSAQLVWIEGGSLGGGAAPTLVGSSVIAAGPGEFYAYNQADGRPNHFVATALSGGGSDVPVYDATRQQFYVPDVGQLTAFKYLSNDAIVQLWSARGELGLSGRLALGPNGNIYTVTGGAIDEIDPNSGAVLRTVPGSFQDYVPPLIQGNYLWIGGLQHVTAYDLATLSPVASITPGMGEPYYYEPAAVDDAHLVINYRDGEGTDRGFIVYAAPEPCSSLLLASAAVCLLGQRRFRRGMISSLRRVPACA